MKTIIMPNGLVEEMWTSGERTMQSENANIIEAYKLAYRKHVLDDDSIGWDELGNFLLNALCNYMGDGSFQSWVNSLKDTDQQKGD